MLFSAALQQQPEAPLWLTILIIAIVVAILVLLYWYFNIYGKKTAPLTANGDDLTVIEGIGPKTTTVLKSAGINTFADLAKTKPADLEKLLSDANLNLGDPATWPQQAKLAADGKMDELKKLQDNLKGGRKA